MVDFGTTPPPKYSSQSGTIRQRHSTLSQPNATTTASATTTTTTADTTAQLDPPSPLLSQLDTPQRSQSPSSRLQEDAGGQQSLPALQEKSAVRLMRCWSIVAIVFALLWVSVSFGRSIVCESEFEDLEDAGQQEPPDASEGVSSFSGRLPSSQMRTDVPDFTYLVNRQAAMFEAFSEFLTSLKTPIIFEDKYDHNRARIASQDSGRDSYGLEARTAASGKESLPLHMSLKMAELAVIDLKVAAKHSLLPYETRTLLVEHLGAFHDAARVNTRKLQYLEARNKGWVEGAIVRNMLLSTELKQLEEMSTKVMDMDIWTRVWRNFCASKPHHHVVHEQKIASVEKKLDRLFFSALKEDRKQLSLTILQVQELQQGFNDMDQTRMTLQDIMAHERGHQEQLARDIMAYVWTHLGGHQVEQETYRKNLALLEFMDNQQKLTGGQLQWILLELTALEAELDMLWERMTDAGVFEPQEGGSQGQGTPKRAKSPASSKQKGQKKTKFSLQDEIDHIDNMNSRLRARKARAN